MSPLDKWLFDRIKGQVPTFNALPVPPEGTVLVQAVYVNGFKVGEIEFA